MSWTLDMTFIRKMKAKIHQITTAFSSCFHWLVFISSHSRKEIDVILVRFFAARFYKNYVCCLFLFPGQEFGCYILFLTTYWLLVKNDLSPPPPKHNVPFSFNASPRHFKFFFFFQILRCAKRNRTETTDRLHRGKLFKVTRNYRCAELWQS